MWVDVLISLLSDPVRVYLLVGDMLATAAVGIGIVSEHGTESDKKFANWLVIGGVIAETFFSAILFVYDGTLNFEQQSKIVLLEEHLEPRSLTDAQAASVVKEVSKALPEKVGKISFVFVASSDEEISLAINLAGNVFMKLGWTWDDWPKELSSAGIRLPFQGRIVGTGIPLSGVQIQVMDSKLMGVEKALVAALTKAGLENVRADPYWDEDMQHAMPRMTVQILIGMRPPLKLAPIEAPKRRRYPKAPWIGSP